MCLLFKFYLFSIFKIYLCKVRFMFHTSLNLEFKKIAYFGTVAYFGIKACVYLYSLPIENFVFQDPATNIFELMIFFHHEIMFYMIMLFILILWFIIRINLFCYKKNFIKTVRCKNKIICKNQNIILEIVNTILPTFFLLVLSPIVIFCLFFYANEFNIERLNVWFFGSKWFWTYNPEKQWNSDSLEINTPQKKKNFYKGAYLNRFECPFDKTDHFKNRGLNTYVGTWKEPVISKSNWSIRKEIIHHDWIMDTPRAQFRANVINRNLNHLGGLDDLEDLNQQPGVTMWTSWDQEVGMLYYNNKKVGPVSFSEPFNKEYTCTPYSLTQWWKVIVPAA